MVQAGLDATLVVAAGTWALVMATLFALDHSSAGNHLIFAELDEVVGNDDELTPREREILELLARGRSKVNIAEGFMISENTVRGHVKRMYAKLGVHGKQELLDLVESAQPATPAR